jgi:hypothetical protein
MNEHQPLMGSYSHHILTPEETHGVSGGQFFNEPLNTGGLPNLGGNPQYPQYPSRDVSASFQMNGGGNDWNDKKYDFSANVKKDFGDGRSAGFGMRGDQNGVQEGNVWVKKDF